MGLFQISIDASNTVYKYIAEHPEMERHRQYLENLWEKYEIYADQNFPIELAQREQFHRRFWEMYLACTLLDRGYQLVRKGNAEGPDVCVQGDQGYIWIEAIAPGGGEGSDSIPESKPESLPEVIAIPEDRIILRYRSAIEAKFRRYKDYIDKGIVGYRDPYIIAINGADVPWSSLQDDIDLPYIVRSVFPFGQYTFTLDWESKDVVAQGYSYQPEILKMSGSSVSTQIFLDEKYSAISGLLSSNTKLLKRPEIAGGDFELLHNPLASNPIPIGWLKVAYEYWTEGKILKRKSWNVLGE